MLWIVVTTSSEVELKTTTSGSMVANVSAADNYNVKENWEWVQKTNWLNLVVWGSNKENNNAKRFSKIPKWTKIFVQWELRLEQYEAKDWTKKVSPKFIVNTFTPFNWVMKLSEFSNTQNQIQAAPTTPQSSAPVQAAPVTNTPTQTPVTTQNAPAAAATQVENFTPPAWNNETVFNFDELDEGSDFDWF